MLAAPTNEPLPQPPPAFQLDALTHIDISTLSQTELHALSLCSASAFDLGCTDDVIKPVIDRSTFNESAGSRRQTYSGPRKYQSAASSPTAATGHRRRIAGLLPATKHAPVPAGDTEHVENKCILNFLKQFIRENPTFSEADLVPPPLPREENRAIVVYQQAPASFGGENKRKRGRKPKAGANSEEKQGLEILNRNGVPVDLFALENSEDPYGDEFRRRTEGMESEEELLGFMSELDGQWGSRRKRRKFVGACHFGDALPVGWKLLLGLKRREGRASIYCRRYISPGGKQFISCREASLYLQSYFGRNPTHRPIDRRVDDIQRDSVVAYPRLSGVTPKEEEHGNEIVISSSSLPTLPASNDHEKDGNLVEVDNLPEGQIEDMFECHKCNETFDQRDTYLQHLLSSHQRVTRRYRLGSSVGDGVIVRDGKYECQFCHKVFQERRRYNGHVGIHVRNYVRKVEETPKNPKIPNTDVTPSQISKMDALIEIDQSSIQETTEIEEPNSNSIQEIHVADSAQKMEVESPHNEQDIEGRMMGSTREEESCQQDSDSNLTDRKVRTLNEVIDAAAKVDSGLDLPLSAGDQNHKRVETPNGVAISTNEIEQGRSCGSHLSPPSGSQKPVDDGSKWTSTSDPEFGFHNDSGPHNHVARESKQQTPENVIPCGVSDSLEQPGHSFLADNADLDKRQGNPVEQRHESVTGFEELRLDEIEPLKYNFLQEVPLDLANNAEMNEAYGQLTTACVWCGVEFSHEAVDSEIQSDSVGFMCPTCKAKISGQLNVLSTGSPMSSHHL